MSVKVDDIEIQTYGDIVKLPTNKLKEQGFRAYAQYLYETQPSFMKRGAQRFECFISFDHKQNSILWDGHPIPSSKLLRSNCKPGEHLGKVVLVLMVKNESKIIERCLMSIVSQIDGFIILDTGSTDETVSIMWDVLTKHNKKGEIYFSEFYDFSSNRTIVAQLAHQRGSWLVLWDADYVVALPDALKKKHNMKEAKEWVDKLPPKSAGIRSLLLNTAGQLQYSRPHIVDGDCRWSYYCRTHEHLGRSKFCTTPEHSPQIHFDFVQIDHIGDGNCKSDKAPRDIVLLLMDLYDNPKSERAFFYLGNSLMGAGLYEWAIRCYSCAMNYCGWFEEMYISSKEMIQCFRFLEKPWERRVAMLLHGMFQNANRLEMLTHFIRDLRHTEEKDVRDEYRHLVCSIAACFAHNKFPSDQKLFIDRYDHELAFWMEVALLCQEVPIYFSLGCFAIRRAKDSTYFQELDTNTRVGIQGNVMLIYNWYQERLKEWDRTHVFRTPQILSYLIQQGHAKFGQRDFALAKQFYTEALSPMVTSSLLPDHLLPTTTNIDAVHNDKKDKDGKHVFRTPILNQLETDLHHQWSPLTAWNAGVSIYVPAQQNKTRKTDDMEAVACYQLALCQQELNSKQKFAIMAYLLDALKFTPTFTPATTMLFAFTQMAKSHFTRATLYCYRLVTFGRLRIQGTHTSAILNLEIEKASDGYLDSSKYCRTRRDQGCLAFEQRTTKRTIKRIEFAPVVSLFV